MKDMYTLDQAWAEAHRLIPAGLELDPESVARAGYPIYRSPVDRLDYVCDLTARLEVNLHNGNKSINLYIDYESEVNSMNDTPIATTAPVNAIATTTPTTTTNNNESEVTNMIDTTITAPVVESIPADTIAADQAAAIDAIISAIPAPKADGPIVTEEVATAVNDIIDVLMNETAPAEVAPAAPIVKPTAYADFLRGLRSEGNRSSMTARVCESVLGMAFGGYKLMMEEVANASVFLTSKVTKGVHKDIVDAENALYTRLSKVFALAGLLVDRSDLYFCAFHCLQLKRTKAVVNEDGTTTVGTMFSTGKTLTSACKMIEVLMGMRLDGYVWNEEHEEFRAATEDQRKKFEKQVEKYNEKKNKPAQTSKPQTTKKSETKATQTTKKSAPAKKATTTNKSKKAA